MKLKKSHKNIITSLLTLVTVASTVSCSKTTQEEEKEGTVETVKEPKKVYDKDNEYAYVVVNPTIDIFLEDILGENLDKTLTTPKGKSFQFSEEQKELLRYNNGIKELERYSVRNRDHSIRTDWNVYYTVDELDNLIEYDPNLERTLMNFDQDMFFSYVTHLILDGYSLKSTCVDITSEANFDDKDFDGTVFKITLDSESSELDFLGGDYPWIK